MRNVPSSGTVPRLNQRSRARRLATISDQRSVCPWPAHCHRGAPRWPWYRCWPPPTFHRFRSPNGRYKASPWGKPPQPASARRIACRIGVAASTMRATLARFPPPAGERLRTIAAVPLVKNREIGRKLPGAQTYESGGRKFESFRARHLRTKPRTLPDWA